MVLALSVLRQVRRGVFRFQIPPALEGAFGGGGDSDQRLDEVIGQDGIRRCAIVLDPPLIRVAAAPKRAFQGWRYLEPKDAPPDLPKHRQGEDHLPPNLSMALAEIGVL